MEANEQEITEEEIVYVTYLMDTCDLNQVGKIEQAFPFEKKYQEGLNRQREIVSDMEVLLKQVEHECRALSAVEEAKWKALYNEYNEINKKQLTLLKKGE